jgi:hypothetical protein
VNADVLFTGDRSVVRSWWSYADDSADFVATCTPGERCWSPARPWALLDFCWFDFSSEALPLLARLLLYIYRWGHPPSASPRLVIVNFLGTLFLCETRTLCFIAATRTSTTVTLGASPPTSVMGRHGSLLLHPPGGGECSLRALAGGCIGGVFRSEHRVCLSNPLQLQVQGGIEAVTSTVTLLTTLLISGITIHESPNVGGSL